MDMKLDLLLQPTNLLEIFKNHKAKGDIRLFVNDNFFIHIKSFKTSFKVLEEIKIPILRYKCYL
jgi:hypothetical protein